CINAGREMCVISDCVGTHSGWSEKEKLGVRRQPLIVRLFRTPCRPPHFMKSAKFRDGRKMLTQTTNFEKQIMAELTITCPKCRTEIKLTESLAAPLIADTRKHYEEELAKKEVEVANREAAIREQ